MPRALTMRSLPGSSDSRAERLRALRERRAQAKGFGCNYWLFADEGDPDAFVEFVEGPDRATLLAACVSAIDHEGPPRILLEVELG